MQDTTSHVYIKAAKLQLLAANLKTTLLSKVHYNGLTCPYCSFSLKSFLFQQACHNESNSKHSGDMGYQGLFFCFC